MWKEALDFDMRADGEVDAGKGHCRGPRVSPADWVDLWAWPMWAWMRTGWAVRWRWRTCTRSGGWRGIRSLSAETIVDEWTRLTFGSDPRGGEDDQRDATGFVARLRELHRAAGCGNADRISRAIITVPGQSRPRKTAGGSGIARIIRESGWIGRWRRGRDTSGSIRRRCRGRMSRWRHVRTAAVVLFIMCLTRMSCIRGRRWCSMCTTRTMRGRSRLEGLLRGGRRLRGMWMKNVIRTFSVGLSIRQSRRWFGAMRSADGFIRCRGLRMRRGGSRQWSG